MEAAAEGPLGLPPKRKAEPLLPASAGFESPPKPKDGPDVPPKVKEDGAELLVLVPVPKLKDCGADTVPLLANGLFTAPPPAVKLNPVDGAAKDCEAGCDEFGWVDVPNSDAPGAF